MAPEPARDAHRRPQVPPHDEADPLPAQTDPEREPGVGVTAGPGAPDATAGQDGAARHAPAGGRWERLAAGVAKIAARLVSLRPAGGLPAAARIRPEAAAAGVIAAGALLLALLAGDGEVEFPGPSFETRMLSRAASPQGAQAPDPPAADAPPAREALAERLVEDPAFPDGGRGGPSAPRREAALPPPPDATPHVANGEDAVAVLSAAVPRPADPALRVLEQRRAGQGLPADARTEPGLAVQLVAVARREQAVEAWTRLQRDNADLLGRLQPIIVEPERRVSTLYRLRAGPVASPREAQALCASLVRRRVDCIVVQAGG